MDEEMSLYYFDKAAKQNDPLPTITFMFYEAVINDPPALAPFIQSAVPLPTGQKPPLVGLVSSRTIGSPAGKNIVGLPLSAH